MWFNKTVNCLEITFVHYIFFSPTAQLTFYFDLLIGKMFRNVKTILCYNLLHFLLRSKRKEEWNRKASFNDLVIWKLTDGYPTGKWKKKKNNPSPLQKIPNAFQALQWLRPVQVHLSLAGLAQYKYNPVGNFALSHFQNDRILLTLKCPFYLYQEPGMKMEHPHLLVVLAPYYVP